MKIVGLLSDEDEIYEMELTAKIFVVEQRMKNLLKDEPFEIDVLLIEEEDEINTLPFA